MAGRPTDARRRLGWVMLFGLSAIAAALLVIHLLWPGRVDAITLALLLVVALPGLGLVLDSAELPGGVKVQFRRLEQRVERNEATADAAMGAATSRAATGRQTSVRTVPALRPLGSAGAAASGGPAASCVRCGVPLSGRFCAVCGTDSTAAATDARAEPAERRGATGTDDSAWFGASASPGEPPPTGGEPIGTPAGPPGSAWPAPDGSADADGSPGDAEPPAPGQYPQAGQPSMDSAARWDARGDAGQSGPAPEPPPQSADDSPVARLAGEYEELRRRMPGGPRRTSLMTDLCGQLIAETVADPHFDPVAALGSGRPGWRLAGYANAYGQPGAGLLDPLRAAVLAERLPFNQYWGLRALRRVLEALPAGMPAPSGLARELTAVYRRLRPDAARDLELDAILGLLGDPSYGPAKP